MEQAWYRIERRDGSGAVVDWVEVGRCAGCGRGVDREFPREYRDLQGVIYCVDCLTVAPRRTAPPLPGHPERSAPTKTT